MLSGCQFISWLGVEAQGKFFWDKSRVSGAIEDTEIIICNGALLQFNCIC